jgi:hypothetical protein
MANINHKRGDTFQLNFTLTDSADAAINLKSEAIYATAPSGQLQTRSWPLGVLNVDIEFTDDSSSPSPVSSSDTFTITVIEDITRD